MSIFDLLFAAAGNVAGNSIYLGNLSLKQDWRAIAYGNGTFVAVANGSSTAVYSKDGGKTFIASTAPESSYVDVIHCVDDKFIASPSVTGGHISVSDDGGNSWIRALSPIPRGYFHKNSVIYSEQSSIIASTLSMAPYLSTDSGASWKTTSLPAKSGGVWKFAKGGGVIVGFIVDIGGNVSAMYSTDDGNSWASASSFPKASWTDITFGDGVFVISSATKSHVTCSYDYGKTWTEYTFTTPAGKYAGVTAMAYGDGIFLGVRDSNDFAVYSSDNGKSWKNQKLPNAWRYQDVAYGDGVFVAVAQSQSQATIIEIAPSV